MRACVAGGLKRVGLVKCKKTLQYLGVESFDTIIQHFQRKMDVYNAKNLQGLQMTFDNIHIDHIKPVKAFGDEINHYTNLQPLLPAINIIKKVRWSPKDEVFWRENIKNNTDYTDVYLSTYQHVDTTQDNCLAQKIPKVSKAISKAVVANRKEARKRERTIRSVSSDIMASIIMPVGVTADYQRMVDGTWSRGCVVTGRVDEINHVYILQCQNSGIRNCIAGSGGHQHENENARLVVVHGYLQYRCFSENCKGSHFVLGVVPASLQAFMDTHTKKKREYVQTDESPVRVEMDEDDSVPVTEEDILHDIASPATKDSDAVHVIWENILLGTASPANKDSDAVPVTEENILLHTASPAMKESDAVHVTEENILHNTSSFAMEDSDAVPELLEPSNT